MHLHLMHLAVIPDFNRTDITNQKFYINLALEEFIQESDCTGCAVCFCFLFTPTQMFGIKMWSNFCMQIVCLNQSKKIKTAVRWLKMQNLLSDGRYCIWRSWDIVVHKGNSSFLTPAWQRKESQTVFRPTCFQTDFCLGM